MTKYESDVKLIYAPQDAVYAKLSDLTHLSVIRDRIDDPMLEQNIMAHAGDKVKPEQIAQLKQMLKNTDFTTDTVQLNGTPLGSITLRIIERETPKCIKFALEGAPIQANLWIQLLPHEQGTLLKCTLGAELNFFIKQMIGDKAKKGVQGLADMLAMIPY